MVKGDGVALCLDVGDRRIGVAHTVLGVATAFPAGALAMGALPETAAAVVDRLTAEGATLLVVGLPLGLDGADTLQTHKVRRFVGFVRRELAARSLNKTVRVAWMDERLSSVAVGRAARTEGLREEDGRATKDQWEAVYILQGYLDRHASAACPEEDQDV